MLDKEEIIINNMYDISYNRAPQVELKTHASMHNHKDTILILSVKGGLLSSRSRSLPRLDSVLCVRLCVLVERNHVLVPDRKGKWSTKGRGLPTIQYGQCMTILCGTEFRLQCLSSRSEKT